MTVTLWVAFGFLAALVVFLIVSYFVTPNASPPQLATLRFLTALCAGMSGGFVAGSSVFEGVWTGPNSKIALSGTAGFALFFVVWFTYARAFHIPLPEGFTIAIPEGWDFEQAATTIAANEDAAVEFIGFRKGELTAALQPGTIRATSTANALEMLRLKAAPSAIRKYRARKSGHKFTIQT
jgi:hypothetical protein